jgi:hypothetical protein
MLQEVHCIDILITLHHLLCIALLGVNGNLLTLYSEGCVVKAEGWQVGLIWGICVAWAAATTIIGVSRIVEKWSKIVAAHVPTAIDLLYCLQTTSPVSNIMFVFNRYLCSPSWWLLPHFLLLPPSFLSFSGLCKKKVIEAEKCSYMSVCVCVCARSRAVQSWSKHFHEQWRLSAIGLWQPVNPCFRHFFGIVLSANLYPCHCIYFTSLSPSLYTVRCRGHCITGT